MAEQVTIEGSLSPSVNLPRGERRRVQLTPEVQRGIDRGYYVVVERRPDPNELTDTEVEADANAQTSRDESGAPARNASRDDWAEFLAEHEGGFVTEGKGRDELIAEWDAYDPEGE